MATVGTHSLECWYHVTNGVQSGVLKGHHRSSMTLLLIQEIQNPLGLSKSHTYWYYTHRRRNHIGNASHASVSARHCHDK